MIADELKKVLLKHSLWLKNAPDGEKADLRDADLRDADLRDADFSRANLSGADLSGAYLREADFSRAYLSGANLSGADLSRADLRGADLSGADFSRADLRGAYLREADLRDADLSGANLSGADGNFVAGYYGKHHATAAGGYICIGCERHTYQEWIYNGEQIGKDNEYTDDEIADYMDWIKLAIRALERMESE